MTDQLRPRVPIDLIKAVVAAEFKIPVREMTSDRRSPRFARPRQVAMALACELTPCSASTVGRVFGGRDHTTVLYAQRKIQALRAEDREFDRRVAGLRSELKPPTPPSFDQVQLTFLDGPLFDWSEAA